MMAYAIVIIKYVSDRLKAPEDSTQIDAKKGTSHFLKLPDDVMPIAIITC